MILQLGDWRHYFLRWYQVVHSKIELSLQHGTGFCEVPGAGPGRSEKSEGMRVELWPSTEAESKRRCGRNALWPSQEALWP